MHTFVYVISCNTYLLLNITSIPGSATRLGCYQWHTQKISEVCYQWHTLSVAYAENFCQWHTQKISVSGIRRKFLLGYQKISVSGIRRKFLLRYQWHTQKISTRLLSVAYAENFWGGPKHRRSQEGQRSHASPQIFRKYSHFVLWEAFF